MERTTILTQNPAADAMYFATATSINMPENPSVVDMNRLISGDDVCVSNASLEHADESLDSPIFGSHIKEAVAITKDWVASRKK